MEMELNNIIAKIKEEGVGEAEKKASEIVSQAEEKAKLLLDNSREESKKILNNAREEAEKMLENGKKALRQASRDVLLSLREQIIKLFDSVMKKEIKQQLSPAVLKEMIVRLTENAAEKKQFDVDILLNEKDKQDLEKAMIKALKETAKKGVTLKVSPDVESGFLIGETGGNTYYDFTDEAIADAFKTYLNPKIARILTVETEKDAE